MRIHLPEKMKRLLGTIIPVIIIIILLILLIVIYPTLFKTLPPKRTEWAYKAIQVNDLRSEGLDGEGVIVGLIDTGIDLTHPELRHVELVAWRDLINRESEPYDDDESYHGTAMAGIIAGKTYGISPEVSLVVVKAIPGDGGASDSNIYSAIRFCMQNGADIISMSLGGTELRLENLLGPWQDSQLEQACNDATEQGIFLVAAAGNDGGENDDGEVAVPGVHDSVITVGAVNEDLKIASFSSAGDNDGRFPNLIINWDPWERDDPNKKPEIVAPGVGIVAPGVGHGYYEFDGTSVSVPFVTGGLALILSELTQYQHENNSGEADITKVKEAIMSTSKKLDNQDKPHDERYGYGLFQAFDLYRELK